MIYLCVPENRQSGGQLNLAHKTKNKKNKKGWLRRNGPGDNGF